MSLNLVEEMKSFAIGIAFAILGLAIAVGLVEIGIRLASRPKPSWSDRPVFYYQAETAESLQDYAYPDPKPANTFRIAVVGDSFSFAPYMQFTDAFPKQLERMLNLNQSEIKAEVINHGVPAYSTVHEVRKAKRAVEQQADLIILQITLNDPEIKGHTPIGITELGRFGPLQLKGFEEKLAQHLKSYAWVRQRMHNQQTVRDYEKYFLSLWENPRSYGSFERALKEIVKIGEDSKTKLVAVVFPLFGLPLDDNYPFYPLHTKLESLLSDLSVPHIDLSPFFKDIPLERLQVIPGLDRHPNEIAHRMAAERIYLWLNDNVLIPEELKIRKKFQGRTKIIKERPWPEVTPTPSGLPAAP